MDGIVTYDWKKFFEERIHSHGPGAPLGGLANSGWKLAFSEVMNDHQRAKEETDHTVDLSYSLGFSVHGAVGEDPSMVIDVIPGSPAAKAGLAPAMRLVAVNGRRWAPDSLREAIRAAKNTKEPIELLIENEEYFHTYEVDY